MNAIDPSDVRKLAVKRLNDRRDFANHVVAYFVINAVLVAIWYFTGAHYFWPVWILGCWGMGLLLHAWSLWGSKPITEDDVRREMSRLQPH